MLAAKAAVFTGVAFLTGLAASFAAFFLGQAIFAGKSIQAHPGTSGTLRPVLGAALYLAVLGLLALGLGALIRRTVGALAILSPKSSRYGRDPGLNASGNACGEESSWPFDNAIIAIWR